ncbi:transporter substrate-binding domain-containing protein [Deferribacterales bacterium Es71-Z0220]|uniref:ATP-binding protein n=1 Tax=Deferrivibrio essentukiensis TaxID=2880922 RepID=UPI001F609E29|nr:ATP-binding protein [Deferrivibrio essentukiensis]MCB4204257.1 transporter substrate-binding domain-containing protein [Deferrivibrio essentukiensis]
MKRYFFVLLILLLTAAAYADHAGLKVGVWNNPPLSIINEDKVSGLAPDLFKHIAEAEGIDYQFIVDTWDSLYEKIQTGEIDVLLPIGYSKNRLSIMDFSDEPIFTNWGQIITNKNAQIKSIIDLKDKKIAVKKNDIFYVGENGLKDILTSFHLSVTFDDSHVSYPEIAKVVAEGNADAGLISRIYSPYIKDSDIETTNIVLKPINVHFAFSKNIDKNIAEKINNRLKNLKSNPDSFYYERLNTLFEHTSKINQKILKILYILVFVILIAFIIIILSRIQVKIKTKELRDTTRMANEYAHKLKTFISSMPEVAFVLDSNGKYVEIFTENEALLYAKKEDLLGKYITDILPPETAKLAMMGISESIKNKKTVEFEYELDVIGGKKTFIGKMSPIEKFDENDYVLFLAIDITKIKSLESELKRSKDRLQIILKSIADAVVVVDLQKKITFVNRTCEKILEKSEHELLGKDFFEEFDLKTVQNKNYVVPFEEIFHKGLMGKVIVNCILTNKNGKRFNIEDSVAPLYDIDSKIIGAVFIFSDVTEKMKLEAEIIKNQHLESLGRIAGGIAHDFNNYLAAISSYVSICKISGEKPDESKLNSLENILKRATALTKQLLTFSKGGTPVIKPANIVYLIEETVKFILTGTSVNLTLKMEENLPLALIDYDQISQVISNIVINARDAMNNKGKLDISVSKTTLPSLNSYNLDEGDYILISIRDHGPGIPEDIKDKIFEPFFTTKADGNGLGLATSVSIIKKHGGRISVYSEEGKGAEFVIFIKASFQSSNEEDNTSQKVIKNNYNLNILYMDDEEYLRDSLSMLLDTLGCRVDLAKNGEEAIEKVKNNNYDLIILDLTIKDGMGGQEAANKILQIKNDAYLVVTSGYSSDDTISNYKNYGFKDYLGKPFSFENITSILNSYLKIG